MTFIPFLDLEWRPERVAQILLENGVCNRSQLAKRLETVGIPRKSVYRAFDKTWRGQVTGPVVVALAKMFSVPLGELLVEPYEEAEKPRVRKAS